MVSAAPPGQVVLQLLSVVKVVEAVLSAAVRFRIDLPGRPRWLSIPVISFVVAVETALGALMARPVRCPLSGVAKRSSK
jgi:hypothetical protein